MADRSGLKTNLVRGMGLDFLRIATILTLVNILIFYKLVHILTRFQIQISCQ